MAGVTLTNVTKKYDEVTAVNKANLEIEDKEFLVLVGPSGCGKTTTLRMVAGLEDISSGTIEIGDTVVNDIPPKDRDIAMVFQNYALYPHMDVYNNMAFGLKLRKFPKDEIDRRVHEAAEILGIENLLDRKPKQLSGGQRQRVAVGRAIVREPKVFLLDEPLSNLDAKLRDQMRTELSKIHNRLQTTFIYVTHDQREAMTMGDRIVVMRDGFIQQVDDPITIYNHPANMFVAGFIGTPPMNFFDAKVVKEGDKYYLDGAGSFKVLIPGGFLDKAPELKDYNGKDVVFGIRPEDLKDASLNPEEANDDNSFMASVEVVEPMGSEIYLYMTVAEHSMIARVEAQSKAAVGDNVKLIVDTDKMHVFDAETEEIII
ncbi:sn-glycerol-3-phosphate ABC transporter ATP-binding protein UgpC [Iocasia frigidifontis]|uniref:sn-glycerol-3-phosphate ABC transporter ATP-binding protein UgpC n=1 Tax=Iocasia fonsfrigidae TaxID=2682810 RepID=A0A8A7KD65_9FIRM|nr:MULTISPECIES: sn-glycerol-3-phosphate ABC transporter ATP-binding protein UgpC [Halanaerobiaceae]AZO93132.1 sn-glycerol-3-phosphate ABC transporter ATP-binding protein UgpC [Halocella sp. SP3-1]QTL99371.1 sn-glycerol-3-phosphate ABC transporter ATP-binding protein UgpC [Iocasia fonsfrigidae]